MAETEIKERRQTCTDHCSTCGQHFHGLKAFDIHQRNGMCSYQAGEPGRQAISVWTEDGSCSKVKGCWENGQLVRWEYPVTIWQMTPREGDAERLLKLSGQAKARGN